jgi:hypothetical protein
MIEYIFMTKTVDELFSVANFPFFEESFYRNILEIFQIFPEIFQKKSEKYQICWNIDNNFQNFSKISNWKFSTCNTTDEYAVYNQY